MKQNKKVVYIHRKKTDDTIFYIGIGNEDRPYQKAPTSRSVVWHRTVKKHGYYVEVIFKDLSKEEACEIEIYLIEKLGRRDLKKGSLVNLTGGGEGATNMSKEARDRISEARSESVYNIETGEIFSSIDEGCKSIGISRGAIGDQLRNYKKKNIRKNNVLRKFNNPYPQNTVFWNEVRKHEVSIESDEFKKYDEDSLYYEDIEFDDNERYYLDKFYNLSETKQELIEQSYNNSDRQIGEKFNINYGYAHKKRMQGVKEVLGDDFYLYKNKRLKHKKSS